MNPLLRSACLLSLLLLLSACGGSKPEHPPLPTLNLNADRLMLAGLSSGGYMVHQLHLAWPEEVRKVAVFAAGPYACARAGLSAALQSCMYANRPIAPASVTRQLIEQEARQGHLGDPEQLSASRVFLYQAEQDRTVQRPVTQALVALYTQLGVGALEQLTGAGAGHGFPAQTGNACSSSEPPYVNNCGFSGAGLSLNHLEGDALRPLVITPQGSLTPFDQTAYKGNSKGLADTGYLYVPPACAEGGQDCGLLMVLHGCDQYAGQVGTAFIEQSGYLQEADARNLVAVFPQAKPTLPNPKGCWDWWGYESSKYDTRGGLQMLALRSMWQALLGK